MIVIRERGRRKAVRGTRVREPCSCVKLPRFENSRNVEMIVGYR